MLSVAANALNAPPEYYEPYQGLTWRAKLKKLNGGYPDTGGAWSSSVRADKGSLTREGEPIQKTNLSSDWSLQLDSMKSESLVIVNQQCHGEYVLGRNKVSVGESADGLPPFNIEMDFSKDYEVGSLESMESTVRYHPVWQKSLTYWFRTKRTVFGILSRNRNPALSVKVKGCLTVRLTGRTDTKVGLSDLPMLSGKVGTQRIKVTPGITGLSFPRDHIDEKDWHLDVGSSHPGGEATTKGNLRGAVPSTRGPGWTNQWRTSCHVNGTAG
ncbi:7810_t:CDS:2 [Entrophospora sp. SA101]|nr:7810_t:CDS:2 [Entrophospora sp. SA101]